VRVPEPTDGDERSILLGWLAFHRNAVEAKCADLDAAQLVERSAPPSPLLLLGLVRRNGSSRTPGSRAIPGWMKKAPATGAACAGTSPN
jgi:hypothetical protein